MTVRQLTSGRFACHFRPMGSRRDELERFKTQINLSEYAAACGYAIDRRRSSRSSVSMKHPDGSRLLITKAGDGHWIFCSPSEPGFSGSIVDFVMRTKRLNIGQARVELRPWVGGTALPPRPPPELFAPAVELSERDPAAVLAVYQNAKPCPLHPYLMQQRSLPEATLCDSIFVGRIMADGSKHGNVLLPHFDRSGVCGFELKNAGFTAFAKGGVKGLWCSRPREEDTRLVIAETGIDALSYAALHGTDGTRFVSVAGSLNPEQPELLAAAIKRLPEGGEVIAATDHDDAGDRLAEELMELHGREDAPRTAFTVHRPQTPGQDWNDIVRARRAPLDLTDGGMPPHSDHQP